MDLKIGQGRAALDRKRVTVAYTLRANDEQGEILDGPVGQFSFRLGRGEVVQGWDIGLEGMKEGGERVLIVPPAAGYKGRDIGAGKTGDLWFKVKLTRAAN